MGSGQTAQLVVSDEDAWVARYVEMGGDEQAGRALFQRMQKSVPGTPSSTEIVLSPHNAVQPVPLSSANEPDLFEDATTPVPPQPSLVPVLAEPQKKRRGRPAVNWSDRPKSKGETALFQLSLDIEEQPPKEANQLGVIATAMIYASLPHSEIEGAVFKRKNGDISLTILNDPEIGLPYGKMPRLITAFLCTEAKRTQEPVIFLGRSKNEFAKKLGLGTNGGKRGDLTRLMDQAKRLFTSHITLTGSPNSQFHWRNVNLTDDGMLLWNPHDPDLQTLWESKLTLSQKFYDECIAHSVPIDLRVLHKLRSPLAIDIYIWMTYRYNSIAGPTPISWKQLKWQFGANYADEKNFITNFKSCLRIVASVYREAKFSLSKDTLTLYPSRPHVLPNPD